MFVFYDIVSIRTYTLFSTGRRRRADQCLSAVLAPLPFPVSTDSKRVVLSTGFSLEKKKSRLVLNLTDWKIFRCSNMFIGQKSLHIKCRAVWAGILSWRMKNIFFLRFWSFLFSYTFSQIYQNVLGLMFLSICSGTQRWLTVKWMSEGIDVCYAGSKTSEISSKEYTMSC